jgi:hypothetical protein
MCDDPRSSIGLDRQGFDGRRRKYRAIAVVDRAAPEPGRMGFSSLLIYEKRQLSRVRFWPEAAGPWQGVRAKLIPGSVNIGK